MRISDGISDVCSSDLGKQDLTERGYVQVGELLNDVTSNVPDFPINPTKGYPAGSGQTYPNLLNLGAGRTLTLVNGRRMVSSASGLRSEEHTSELQSLMRISYAVFCLKKKKTKNQQLASIQKNQN